MSAKTCKITGRQRSKQSVLRRIARDLNFPDHFRPNLDALMDVLTTDIKGPIEILWRPTPGAIEALGADFNTIAAALKDAAAERGDLKVVISPPSSPEPPAD